MGWGKVDGGDAPGSFICISQWSSRGMGAKHVVSLTQHWAGRRMIDMSVRQAPNYPSSMVAAGISDSGTPAADPGGKKTATHALISPHSLS